MLTAYAASLPFEELELTRRAVLPEPRVVSANTPAPELELMPSMAVAALEALPTIAIPALFVATMVAEAKPVPELEALIATPVEELEAVTVALVVLLLVA